MSATKLEPVPSEVDLNHKHREEVFDAFRRWGHLQAQLDPLGQYLTPEPVPDLDYEGEDAEEARRCYCGTIAAEFMHIPYRERRQWIASVWNQKRPSQTRSAFWTCCSRPIFLSR